MILIGVPCGENVKARTAFSLFNLRGGPSLSMEIGADIAYNRNKLVMQALKGDYTHIFFVDSDMVFEKDTIEKMRAQNKDIVGLAANRRKLPLESVVKPLHKDDENKPLPTVVFEAASCGTGVMLIKTDVFRKIPAPWFDFEYDEKGDRVGEDVGFCRKAREAGYKIWVDPTIPVRHVGEYLY